MQYIIVFFMLAKLLIHLPFNGRYGYHADELLYIAMSDQLAWGYKEGPPLIAFLSWASMQLADDSLWVLRLIPTLCAAALVGLTGFLTRMLGGGPVAVLIACTAILLDPSFLATGYMMQPVVFDQLGWALSCLFLIRFIQTGHRVNLLYLGIVAGIGMMNKFSIAMYIISLLAALLPDNRRWLTVRALVCISAPALIIFLPHLLWQLNHNFPFISQLKELNTHYWSGTGYPTLLKQLLFSHGASGLVSFAGLIFFLTSERMRRYRFLGLAFILVQSVFLYLQAKTYYSFGAFPVLYAGGAILIAELFRRWKSSYIRVAFFATIVIPGLFALPAVVPVLSISQTVAWLETMKRHTGIEGPLQWDDGTTRRLPQYFAQMLGWEKLADETMSVYQSLPESKRTSTLVLTDNYQQAGAISFYGKDEVPQTVSVRPSFFSGMTVKSVPEYIIVVTSASNPPDISPVLGLLSSQRFDYPHAEVNGSYIYLIRRRNALAYQAP